MDPLTLRLEEEVIEELDAEYEERGFRNRTLYIRRIIEQRDAIFDDEGAEVNVADRLADVEDRLDDLENRAQPFSWEERGT